MTAAVCQSLGGQHSLSPCHHAGAWLLPDRLEGRVQETQGAPEFATPADTLANTLIIDMGMFTAPQPCLLPVCSPCSNFLTHHPTTQRLEAFFPMSSSIAPLPMHGASPASEEGAQQCLVLTHCLKWCPHCSHPSAAAPTPRSRRR